MRNLTRLIMLLIAVCASVLLPQGTSRVHAFEALVEAFRPKLHWRSFSQACAGDCAIAVYGGSYVFTEMTEMFGIEGISTFAPDRFKPAWDWDYGDSSLIAVAGSRRILSFGELIDIEGEIGLAQRFGDLTATETWAAFYIRWVAFPWNDYIRTTIAVSTGLNYASHVDALEKERSSNKKGSHLLHFFSPEITLALPQYPEWELLGRIHHRSGGKILFGDVPVFNGVDGGAHYATVGLRYRF